MKLEDTLKRGKKRMELTNSTVKREKRMHRRVSGMYWNILESVSIQLKQKKR